MIQIYHYTSVEVLNKILNTKKLRFTQMNSLNDISEYKYGIELLKQKIVEYEQKHLIKRTFNTSLLDQFTFLNSLCSTSFTENRDDYSFWNSYYVPKNGAVCIGIYKDLISDGAFIANKCIYGDPYPLMEEKRYEWFTKIFNINNILYLSKNIEYIHITFQTAHIKDPRFAIEREWRAVSFLPPQNEQSEFERNGKKIRCFDQPFNTNSIFEIVIGPSISQKQTFEKVKELITKYKIECDIIKSSLPLRL